MNRSGLELFMKVIQMQQVSEDEPNPEFKVFLKYAMRCVAMCLRTRTAVNIFLHSKTTFNMILDFISILEDEEIVANAAKILKMMLNEPEIVVSTYK